MKKLTGIVTLLLIVQCVFGMWYGKRYGLGGSDNKLRAAEACTVNFGAALQGIDGLVVLFTSDTVVDSIGNYVPTFEFLPLAGSDDWKSLNFVTRDADDTWIHTGATAAAGGTYTWDTLPVLHSLFGNLYGPMFNQSRIIVTGKHAAGDTKTPCNKNCSLAVWWERK